jgi:uncharacterized protein with FMN-binding domain
MKKFALPLLIVAVSGAYAWSQQGAIEGAVLAASNSLSASAVPGPVVDTAAILPARLTQAGVATPTIIPVASSAPSSSAGGQFKDGSYQGSVADAYYGNVQVQANVKNGQLVSVRILQYPSDRNTSRYINSQALPMLKQEAIQAQSSQVDFVSGATLTSNAFVQSLTAALGQAQSGSTI